MDLTPYLKLMRDKQASDMFVIPGAPVKVRLEGKDKPVGKEVITPEMSKLGAYSIMSPEHKKQLAEKKSVDFTFPMPSDNTIHFRAIISYENKQVMMIVRPAKAEKVEKTEKAEKPAPAAPAAAPAGDSDEIQVLGAPPQGHFDLLPYLREVIKREGSDLFLTVGSSVKVKISGKAIAFDRFILTPEMTKSAVFGIMTDEQIEEFERVKDLDFAIEMPDGSARFRANAFFQRKTIGLVMRLIPSKIPNAKDMGTPEVLLELIMAKRGLLLMVGGTGSGKSTTLAAMINHRNANSPGHILTIEDPVEFSHPNQMSIVNQREVGVDTASYARALKASLREAPDVILIGEIRDRETMEAGLELANTGHLCISTMHANNANQAMERIINMFPNEMHKQLLMDISGSLQAVVSQRLIPDVRGKRVAAIEVLINTPHIANLIMQGKLNEIKEAMQSSGTKGIKTFDGALFDLYREGKISLEEALKNADSRNDLEAKINFG
jgi:twitching motility protein PilU